METLFITPPIAMSLRAPWVRVSIAMHNMGMGKDCVFVLLSPFYLFLFLFFLLGILMDQL